ncbi:zinc ribbon domain-containing protein, partial [Turicibacter sanguinis]|nr:zinc ribbon domain-containing protein [Turicibacter sanguinis]
MAFWDDFQKNMNKTANASIKTTSKWIEIGKLNVALNAAKLDLNDLYERIGEYVYQNKIVDVK